MSFAYENQRDVFDGILRKYKEYLNLYTQINNGSAKGACTFAEFYWRMTYYSTYADNGQSQERGY